MDRKICLKYFVYIVLIVALLYLKNFINARFENSYLRYMNTAYLLIGKYIINLFIGIILGLDNLIAEMKKEGSWKINLPKLLIIAIPALYFSLGIMIYYMTDSILSVPAGLLIKNGNSSFMDIFQLILGYSIITSFYKSSQEPSIPYGKL